MGLVLMLVVFGSSPASEAEERGGRKVGSPRFSLNLRRREKDKSGTYFTRFESSSWDPDRTAVVICDMWDTHHCPNAVERVTDMAPRLNSFVSRARQAGAVVIHAPSSCMEFYKDHPARKRAREAPGASKLPADIGKWCHQIPSEEEADFPVDHSDGGCDADAAKQEAFAAKLKEEGRNPGSPWKRQIGAIEISDDDYISDAGVEVWNILEERGVDNVMLVGVHTNMCVLGRPFGLRQMAKNGKNTVLVRDLTDTMYNPAKRPFLSHFRGTDRVVEHIEKYVCPTITSDQILGGTPHRFERDDGPHVVFIVGEGEYQTRESLSPFAREELEPRGVRSTFVHVSEKDPNDFPGIEVVKDADVLFVSVRRRALRNEHLELIRQHLAAGKALIGIRTASHAFDPRGELPEGHGAWREFDREVLGADYDGHFGSKGPKTVVQVLDAAAGHPILAGISREVFELPSTLYKTRNPQKGFTPLMEGRLRGTPTREVCAWTHEYKGARVFYTSLGHVGEFEKPFFRQLLVNGVFWAARYPVPEPAAAPK